MCFTKLDGDRSHLVAEEDIYCYKVLLRSIEGDYYYSPYYQYKYNIGTLYNHELSKSQLRYMDLSSNLDVDVFHSYNNLVDAYDELGSVIRQLVAVGSINVPYIVKCVIPKGTEYWENDYEYASVAIKVVEVIK